MPECFDYIKEYDVVFVRDFDTNPFGMRETLVAFERYLKSSSYRPGQDFICDMEFSNDVHANKHLALEFLPDLLGFMQTYGFRSKTSFYTPNLQMFEKAQKLEKLINKHITWQVLITSDFNAISGFVGQPLLKIEELREKSMCRSA